MKKYPYIIAAACVLVGALGFTSVYVNQQAEQEKQLAQEQQLLEKTRNILDSTSMENLQENAIENELTQNIGPQLPENLEELQEELPEELTLEDDGEEENEEVEPEEDAQVGSITPEVIHFDVNGDMVWPVEGPVLLDYSMDSTIFFPTLQQYQYNPAMIFSAEVNSKVYFIARGKISSIVTNEETGCTVTQDLGDGYTAIYGQLKELNFEVGDMVEAGQVLGYVGEPTKYYSLEGSNVYFQVLKDGVPVDPDEILQ